MAMNGMAASEDLCFLDLPETQGLEKYPVWEDIELKRVGFYL